MSTNFKINLKTSTFQEQINVPAVDEINEEPSEVVPVDDKWKVNAWQQTVPNTDNIVSNLKNK